MNRWQVLQCQNAIILQNQKIYSLHEERLEHNKGPNHYRPECPNHTMAHSCPNGSLVHSIWPIYYLVHSTARTLELMPLSLILPMYLVRLSLPAYACKKQYGIITGLCTKFRKIVWCCEPSFVWSEIEQLVN